MTDSDSHELFFNWSIKQGIEVHSGIKAAKIAGKGYGIVAVSSLKRNELLVKLPASSLVTIDSEIAQDSRIPANVTVHGTLAAAWTLHSTLGKKRRYQEWEATWPSISDVEYFMPLLWPKLYQDILPRGAKALLRKQQVKYEKDWRMLKNSILSEGETEDSFKYNWLLINSRCYYWQYAKSRQPESGRTTLPVDECMALCPYADYFNHASEGCTFAANAMGCSISCNRDYQPGEEVVVSYGPHSNDFLLVEYGFTMDDNEHDSITVDEYILPKLSKEQKSLLEDIGYLGNYGLHDFGVCYRTEVALRALISSPDHVHRFVQGQDSGRQHQRKYEAERSKLLNEVEEEIVGMLKKLKKKTYSNTYGNAVNRRWSEMDSLVKEAKSVLV